MKWITVRVIARQDGMAAISDAASDEGVPRSDGLTIERDRLERFRGSDHYPYEVSYELHDAGPYVVGLRDGMRSLYDPATGEHIMYTCFLPEEWVGQRVLRFVD